MKNWNDIKHLYYKVAGVYAQRYGYPPDELVNAAYIETKDYWDIPANHLMRMINQRMWAFIKKDKFGYSGVQINLYNYLDMMEDTRLTLIVDRMILREELESKYSKIESNSRLLTLLEKIVLFFKYTLNLNDNEVGRILNRSGECARLIKVSALEKLKVT